MKKLVLIALLAIGCFVACEKESEIIFTDLPAHAQTFLEQNFPNNIVTVAHKHSQEPRYEVWLNNGYRLLFYADGRWQCVDAQQGIISNALARTLLMENIVNFIAVNFPRVGIQAIARSAAGYNVTLHTHPTEVVYFDMFGNVTEHPE